MKILSMDSPENKKLRVGHYVRCSTVEESYNAYIPKNLPPDPALDMEDLYVLLDKASTALGRLDGMSMLLPDATLFLYMYIRKEAVLSSQIEGTQSSLSDFLLFENAEVPGAPIDDIMEVSNYVSAMNYGLKRLKEFPLSLRLIREIHDKLMGRGRGSRKSPGEFRSSQNWIGGSRPGNARFVPVPPEHLIETLGEFEKFLHDDNSKLPPLVKAALAHVQFETIHPFLDGNGRLGRLLITFILCLEGVIKEPIFYLSLYFKANREAYYTHLELVRKTGDWESWIKFFLTGVIETANQAVKTAQEIIQLFDSDQSTVQKSKKSTVAILKIYNYFQRHPISDTTKIKKECAVSLPTVLRSLTTLKEIGIIEEKNAKERNKIFVYHKYLDILNKGTEPFYIKSPISWPTDHDLLNLSNKYMDDSEIDSLVNNPQLNMIKKLYLAGNKIGDEGAQCLATVLQSTKNLHTLDLTWNKMIGDAGAVALAKGLEMNTSLKKLGLGGNQIGNLGASHLADALRRNTTLNHLRIESNRISFEGIECLVEMLRANTTLQTLDLVGNKSSESQEAEIKKLLKRNSQLYSF